MKPLDPVLTGVADRDEAAAGRSLNYAYGLLITVAIIVMFGLTMLYSASYNQVGVFFFQSQLLWAGLGLIAGAATVLVGYKLLSDNSGWLILAVTLMLFACLLFPPVNGAQRWIRFPGFTIQPSELAKPVLVLFLAWYCSKNFRSINVVFRRNGALPAILVAGWIMFCVVIGRDLGTTMLMGGVLLVVLFVAGLSLRWYIFPAAGAVGLFVFLWKFVPTRWVRITSFLDPELYASDDGYQLWNSLLALGSGKWLGIGFMESRLKWRYLPEAHNDFILAIVGEELGLVSILLVMIAYLVLGYFGIKIAMNARTRQGLFLAAGVTAMIVLQAAINIGVITGALPTKGIPAPLISYGGSNLIASMIMVGLLVSVALDTAFPGFNEELREWLLGQFKRKGAVKT